MLSKFCLKENMLNIRKLFYFKQVYNVKNLPKLGITVHLKIK